MFLVPISGKNRNYNFPIVAREHTNFGFLYLPNGILSEMALDNGLIPSSLFVLLKTYQIFLKSSKMGRGFDIFSLSFVVYGLRAVSTFL